MKTLFLLALLVPINAFAWPGCDAGISGFPLKFEGEFGVVSATALECERLFATKEYQTQHFTMGSTGTISVLNFRTVEPAGFFHNVSFVGLLGPDCDFGSNKKTFTVGNTQYEISAEGILGRDVLIANVKVKATRAGAVVCTASSEYTGFGR